MSQQQQLFLSLLILPGRLDRQQTAWFTGFEVDNIAILMAAGLLTPLGDPERNGPKYFATCELRQHVGNLAWLNKASRAISKHWKRKNSSRKSGTAAKNTVEVDFATS